MQTPFGTKVNPCVASLHAQCLSGLSVHSLPVLSSGIKPELSIDKLWTLNPDWHWLSVWRSNIRFSFCA
jgi:hypothetical protein